MTEFERLHPSLQHHVVNSLGWRELRPLQEQAIGPILDGASCLMIAPTAGGKTEAAVFPILSRMLSESWRGLSVLYICPIRALLNNLEERLSYYCSLVGRRCGLWHGDVGQAARSKILRDPPDILLTTPESLEAILISRRTDRPYFFGSVQTVIVDEVHAFAGDDRGWHLLAVLERVSELAGRRPQRIGLSATIGNPDRILNWLNRGSEATSRVISPSGPAVNDAEVQLDYVGGIENAAIVVGQLHRGEKRLVFCDSRSQAERLATLLREGGTNTFVSHSSLSADERRQAERAFREARDCVIVATSTLELGIDVGDLDRVLQLEAPTTVASFLQRLGRTGRRSGTKRNCLFLATNRESLIRAAALLRLWKEGHVEPLDPPPSPFPVVAQQIMALVLQEGGTSRQACASVIKQALGLGADSTGQLVDHMLAEGILFDDSGILGLGPEGERLYGAKNYMALMSVFDTPSLFHVLCGLEDLGSVHPLSFAGFGQRPVVISLGGRAWEVFHVDESRAVAHVRPADSSGRSRWLGQGRALRFELCRAVRSLLVGETIDPLWSKRAVAEITAVRHETEIARSDRTVLESDPRRERTRWWTFCGMKGNSWLAARLASTNEPSLRFDNYWVEFPGIFRLAELENSLRDSGRNSDNIPTRTKPPAKVKFWECLAPEFQLEYLNCRFTDPNSGEVVRAEPRVYLDLAKPENYTGIDD